jgi:hypothetical protein
MLPHLGLVLLCIAVYSRVAGFAFLSYDDDGYVTANPHVLGGLTWKGVAWAFTALHKSNWHPLAWLSHMADVELFGLDAGMHHLTNLLLHAADSVLLFVALSRMTGARGRSWFVAALFAVHPLHVESVAWVAERKDLLSAFFFLLTLLAYRAYVRSGSLRNYALVFFSFLCGLMAKPMVVTLPFVLLLLDGWPLGRMRGVGSGPEGKRAGLRPFLPLVLEKVPLFLLSAASAAVTWAAQARGGAVVSPEVFPVLVRFANAILSCAGYLWKAVWPVRLAVCYPHPWESGGAAAWKIAAAALFLGAVSAGAFRSRIRSPWLAAGWLWYLGMLVPVIGLVQVGRQAMADRYTYLPLIGVFVAAVWSIGERFRRLRTGRLPSIFVGSILLLALAADARVQAAVWKDDLALYRHALAVTAANWVVEYNLGDALFRRGMAGEAIPHFREAVRLRPDFVTMRVNFAFVLESAGRRDEAEAQYREALRRQPGREEVRRALESLLMERRGGVPDAGPRL